MLVSKGLNGCCDEEGCERKFAGFGSLEELALAGWRVLPITGGTYCPNHASRNTTPHDFQRKSYRVLVPFEEMPFEEQIWGMMLAEANLSEDHLSRFVSKKKSWDDLRKAHAFELEWYEVGDD